MDFYLTAAMFIPKKVKIFSEAPQSEGKGTGGIQNLWFFTNMAPAWLERMNRGRMTELLAPPG